MGSAAPIIITVVAVVATVYAGPMVGAAIMAEMGVVGASAAATAAVGAAAIGGSTSAVNAAVQGKNVEGVLKAGAIGAAASAAGSVVGGAVGEGVTGATGGPVSISSNLGPTLGANAPGAITRGAVSGATSGFTRAQLSGQNLDQSGKQAAVGGATGAITSAIGEGVQAGGGSPEEIKFVSGLSGPFVAQNVAEYFAPQRSAGTTGSSGQSTQLVGTSPTTGQGAVGSSALGQALRIGSGEPGALIESPGGGETTSKPIWNLASLRVKDETGSET